MSSPVPLTPCVCVRERVCSACACVCVPNTAGQELWEICASSSVTFSVGPSCCVMDYGGGGSEPVEPSLAHDAATSSSDDDDNDDQGSGDGDDSVEGGSGVTIELTTVKFPGCFFLVISSRLTKKDTKKKKTKCFSVGCLSERLIRRKRKTKLV